MSMGALVDIHVCSAHRTPDRAAELAKGAEGEGVDVIIAAAGKAAHLPGVLAAYTALPVIGIPIKSSALEGLDALLSIVQMPPGVPVATVAIDGAENAALLALQIIATRDAATRGRLKQYKADLVGKIAKKDAALRERFGSIS
jgi:5-(carboxyamino)imidazole ribonucleotide mutase